MTWNIICLAEVPARPWRNGGGVTRELAVSHEGEDWIWRMSVAEVEKSGPFSNFEGMNRWFAVLSGSGVSLDMAGRIQHLTVNSAPFCFDGGEKINCHLLDGKTQDFNLMVRKSRANASMRRVNGLLQMTLKNPQIIAVYSINSETVLQVDEHSLCLPPSSLAWRHIHQPVKVSVSSTHALWMDIPE